MINWVNDLQKRGNYSGGCFQIKKLGNLESDEACFGKLSTSHLRNHSSDMVTKIAEISRKIVIFLSKLSTP